MAYVIPVPAITTIPVIGGGEFPVRRIYCVGRNYAAHAKEMGYDPNREPPFFFMKPSDAIVENHSTVPYPPKTTNYHHEIELVVALGQGGKNIPVEKALDTVFAYGVGLDMTRRDLQGDAKKMGRPWEMGKGFDHSAPCSALSPVSVVGHPNHGSIWLKVNETLRQEGDLSDQIWRVEEAIAFLSQFVELFPGDLIYTGTPEGVGAVKSGDTLHGHIDGLEDLYITIS